MSAPRLATELQLEPSAEVRRLIAEIRAELHSTEHLGPGEGLAATAGEAEVDAPTPRRRPETVQVGGTRSGRPRWGWLVALGIAIPTLFLGLRATGIPDPSPADFSIADLPLWFADSGFEGPDTTPGAPAVTAWITFAGSRSVAAAGAGGDFGRLEWTGRLPSDPYGVALTPDGRFAYVGLAGPRPGVFVISTATNTVVDSVAVFDGGGAVTFTPDGAFAWVATSSATRITVINTTTLKRTYTSSIPGRFPVGITLVPNNR